MLSMYFHEPVFMTMNYTLRINDHLQLTEFQEGDQQYWVRYLNDPELYRNTLTVPSPYTQKDGDERLEKLQANKTLYGMPTDWAIRHATDSVIGGVGVFMKKGLDGHLDELGYWLAAPFRGQGIISSVVPRFVDWQFALRPSLLRLEAIVYAHNAASARVLEKGGFTREGYMRKYVWKDGQSMDAILYAKIREEGA